MTRAKLTPAMVTAKINTAKLRADATAAVGIDLSLDGDPSPFAAVAIVCCDEIDRLRADLATASGACETWKSDARRLAADVAAMLPIVEAVANAGIAYIDDEIEYYAVHEDVVLAARELQTDRILAARKVTP